MNKEGHKDTRTRGVHLRNVNVDQVMIYQVIKELSLVVWRTEQQTGSPSGELMICGAWSCVSPSHTPHSTATRLKLGDGLPLFTGQNYNSVAAFIDETDCGTATTLILRYLLLHNIITHLLLNIVFKTILICCACQLDITKPAWKAWGCESCLTILP